MKVIYYKGSSLIWVHTVCKITYIRPSTDKVSRQKRLNNGSLEKKKNKLCKPHNNKLNLNCACASYNNNDNNSLYFQRVTHWAKSNFVFTTQHSFLHTIYKRSDI